MADKEEKKVIPLNGFILIEREKKASIFDNSNHLPSHQYIYKVIAVGKDVVDLSKDSKVVISLQSIITPVVGIDGMFLIERKFIIGEVL